MTITRLWQAGAELQHVNELEENSNLGTSSSFTISSVKAKTGTYSFRNSSGSANALGKTISSTTQIRAGVFLNHGGLTVSASIGVILAVTTNLATPISTVRWNGNTGLLELRVNGSTVASVAPGAFTTTNTWEHCAITYKADSSAGFFTLYLDGVQVLTWTGNTGTAITGVWFCGHQGGASGGWANTSAYWDDFYIDDAVGELDVAPPSPRFSFLLVNGAGASAAWNLVGAATNHEAIDDPGAPDDDTTYLWTDASGTKDYEALANTVAGTTVPTGYSIDAVIVAAWAKKTNAGVASTLKLGVRASGGTEVLGSAQSLATSYGPVFFRRTTNPAGSSWSESDVDGTQTILESAGSFS